MVVNSVALDEVFTRTMQNNTVLAFLTVTDLLANICIKTFPVFD